MAKSNEKYKITLLNIISNINYNKSFISDYHINTFKEKISLYEINKYTYSKISFFFLMTIEEKFTNLIELYYNDKSQKIDGFILDDTFSSGELTYIDFAIKILNLKDKIIIKDKISQQYYLTNKLDYSEKDVKDENKSKILAIRSVIEKSKKISNTQRELLLFSIEIYLTLLNNVDNIAITSRKQNKSITIRFMDDEYNYLIEKVKESGSPNITFYVKNILFSDKKIEINNELNQKIDEVLEIVYGNNMQLNQILRTLKLENELDKDSLKVIEDLSNSIRTSYKSLNKFSKKIN